jgi:hypothetical protein
MPDNKLTYEWNQDIVILHFPEIYYMGHWGEILELVRDKKIPWFIPPIPINIPIIITYVLVALIFQTY